MNLELNNEKNFIKLYSKMAGKKIRRNRVESGITQEELAERVDIDAKHLGRIERGEKTPLGPTLISIFYELQIEADELYNLHVKTLQQLEDKNFSDS